MKMLEYKKELLLKKLGIKIAMKIIESDQDIDKITNDKERLIFICDLEVFEAVESEKYSDIFEKSQFLIFSDDVFEEHECKNTHKINNLCEIEKMLEEIVFEKKNFIWGREKHEKRKFLVCGDEKNLMIKEFKEKIMDPVEGISYSIYTDPKQILEKFEENKIKEKYFKGFLQPEELFREIEKGEKIDLENDFQASKGKILKEVTRMYEEFYDKVLCEHMPEKSTIRELVYEKIEQCGSKKELIKFFVTLWTGEPEKFYNILNRMVCDRLLKEVSLSMYLISLNYNYVEGIQSLISYNWFEKLYRTDRVLDADKMNGVSTFVNEGFWATTKRPDIKVFKKFASSYIEIHPYDERNLCNGFFLYLDISKISKNEKEKEVLFLPFCQFHVKKVVKKTSKLDLDNIVLLQMEGMYSVSQNFFLIHKVKLSAELQINWIKDPIRRKQNVLILDELFKNCLNNEDYFCLYCNLKGTNYLQMAEFNLASQFLKKATEIENKIGGKDSLINAINYNSIGGLLEKQGKYDEAYYYYLKSLEIFKNILGEEHPNTATSYNNIGALLMNQGKYEEAYYYYLKSLEITRKLLGEEHTDIALSYNNIGEWLMNQGKYEEAYKYHLKSLEIFKNILGEEHPNTATSYNNIGALLMNQGKYEEAYNYYMKSLEIKRKLLGEEHPNTARSYNNIGELLMNQGKYEEAYKYYMKSLEITRNILGEEHTDIALSYNNIGALLMNQGKYEEAYKYYMKSLEIFKNILGEEHPDTASSYNNIGELLMNQGKYEEAYKYYMKSLEIKRKLLGEEHPNTARSYNNIGELLMNQGKYEEAYKYYMKSLEITRNILGEEHPDTALSYNYLAYLLFYTGQYNDANENIKKAYKIWKNSNHPNTKIAENLMKQLNLTLKR